MNQRPSKDKYFLVLAYATSARATCVRRRVGAVAIDSEGYILSTGYNGSPKESIHCIDKPCVGHDAESGTNLDDCKAIHAEANLIAHCSNPRRIHTIYLTVTPCMSCMKLITATGCRRIVASEIYHRGAIDYFKECDGEVEILSIDL